MLLEILKNHTKTFFSIKVPSFMWFKAATVQKQIDCLSIPNK